MARYHDLINNTVENNEVVLFMKGTADQRWPTSPQLFVRGKLIGGSDIMQEMYHSGELQKLLKIPVKQGQA